MRSIWNGSISFGLINIPINLFSASHEKRFEFHYIRKKDLCPIKYVKVCQATGEEVSFSDIAKGYENEDGKYVVLEEEDFKKANLRKTQTIDIFQFVQAWEIPHKYYEKPYYLKPTKQSSKVYSLFCQALKKSGKIGLGKFVLRNREKLVTVMPEDNIIVLNQIRFEEELVDADLLEIAKEKVVKRDLDIAVSLINQLTDKFVAQNYKDTYSEELQRVIDQKLKGVEPQYFGEKVIPTTEMEDIVAKLKQSLEYAKKEKR